MLPDRYASSPSGNSQSPQNIPATSNPPPRRLRRSEEHTSELQSRFDLVCRLLLEKKKKTLSRIVSCGCESTECAARHITPTARPASIGNSTTTTPHITDLRSTPRQGARLSTRPPS